MRRTLKQLSFGVVASATLWMTVFGPSVATAASEMKVKSAPVLEMCGCSTACGGCGR